MCDVSLDSNTILNTDLKLCSLSNPILVAPLRLTPTTLVSVMLTVTPPLDSETVRKGDLVLSGKT